ncbi:FtsX-like permease family protein [Peptostreptococcaceae bacterium OttesenSCG-928-C18]|nr:FtsX-like permease family protein [Peptostreptococcaceae bacterium OttesenSCG-928-C18]
MAEKQVEYDAGIAMLNPKKQEFEKGQSELNTAQNKIDTNKTSLANGKSQYGDSINLLKQQIDLINQGLSNPAITPQEQSELENQLVVAEGTLAQVEVDFEQFMAETYQPGMAQIQAEQELLNQKQEELDIAKMAIQEVEATLVNAKQQLDDGYEKIDDATNQLNATKATLAEKEQMLINAKAEIATNEETLINAKTEIAENEQKLNDAKIELDNKEQEYQDKLVEFQEGKIDAEKEILEKEQELLDAQESIDTLKPPVYSINNRRESPGSTGYKMYNSISNIVDSLANIFPIFLYFVAALVTFTTMTRFVDDERINSGTLKALGYNDHDIIRKFTTYGLISSMLGSIIGIYLGHRLLPAIVYNAYYDGFGVPKMEIQFYPWISVAALLLAFISAVVPAYMVAKKELKEKPTALLLPKPPSAGSKIFLERITPLWNRMSFTHKVTARNIFRYKKRMFMTIFGVCGSVALLFTGLGVQKSISKIGDRQFEDIIHYDLIVAQNENLKENDLEEISNLLNSDNVTQYSSIYFEELTTVTGKSKEKQVIKFLVPENGDTFDEYIELMNRKTQDKLAFSDDGAIITERLANILNVKEGDLVTLKNSDDKDVTIKIVDITEMYIGHFIFMNSTAYEQAFGEEYTTNANIVILTNGSQENTEKQAAGFMKLAGIKGVVQNSMLTTQIDTLVIALDKIMKVLVVVAALLAIVILYNLTNINVSERIRELSTIKVLGFYNNEVTMYIYRETLLLSLIGIFAGYGFGAILHRYILVTVPPDEVMFSPAVWPSTFIVPAVVIAITTVVLGTYISRKLAKVDMLEALKSVE